MQQQINRNGQKDACDGEHADETGTLEQYSFKWNGFNSTLE